MRNIVSVDSRRDLKVVKCGCPQKLDLRQVENVRFLHVGRIIRQEQVLSRSGGRTQHGQWPWRLFRLLTRICFGAALKLNYLTKLTTWHGKPEGSITHSHLGGLLIPFSSCIHEFRGLPFLLLPGGHQSKNFFRQHLLIDYSLVTTPVQMFISYVI